jgi:hypothetical protein
MVPNEPEVVRRASPLAEFLHFCTNPLVLILLVASMISASLGELLNAAIWSYPVSMDGVGLR